MMCEADWKGGFMGSVLYFTWCVALLIIPRQADKIGRKWLFLGSRIVECMLFVASLLVTDYWTMVALLGVFGLCAAGRINVGTVYLTEWMPRKN
jgi:MFS family permease